MNEKKYHHGDLKNALIEAGVDILTTEGVHELSLRKVAARAGVSHAAPYAHFADKQALIAAISTEGFRRLYERVRAAAELSNHDPRQQFIETAWAYVQFALDDPAHFKVMFSGALKQEKDYPEFVELSQKNFRSVVTLVERCQAAGLLQPGPADELAISVWSLVHGFIALILDDQVSHAILKRYPLKELLIHTLNPITCMDLQQAEAKD
jgi:AcrR family transcriptional regulator